MSARIAGRSSGRRSRARAAIVSSTSEPVIWICSLAARKVVIASGSRVASHPVRMPGSPNVFDIPDTPMARLDRAATGGNGSP